MKTFRRSLLALAVPALLVGAMSQAGAAETADIIKYRQANMKALGGSIGMMAAIMKGKVDYKGALTDHARALHSLTLHIEDAFPEGSTAEDSAAKPEIWQKWSEFQDAAKEARLASAEMVAAAESGGDVGAAFKRLGESCGGCHKPFRVKKD